jgi:AAA domain (dynein-related subfamily)
MAKFWIVACGEAKSNQWVEMWPEWLKYNHITVGCNSPADLDLTKLATAQRINALEDIRRVVGDANQNGQAPILYNFAHSIRDKDYVVIRKGKSHVLGIGQIDGEIEAPTGRGWKPGNHYQIRKVTWLHQSNKPILLGENHKFNIQATIQDTKISYDGDLADFDSRHLNREDDSSYDVAFISYIVDLFNKNKKDNIGDGHAEKKFQTELVMLNFILYGPPGTGKTHALTALTLSVLDPERTDYVEYAERIFNGKNWIPKTDNYKNWHTDLQKHLHEGRVEFTTFHQNYTYEDFVEGLKAYLDEKKGSVHYKIEPGILKRITYRALYSWLIGGETDFELDNDQITKVEDYLSGREPHGNAPKFIPNYVLVIDEINRGNVARIFGELITLVEDSKRACRDITPGAQPLFSTLPYSKDRFILPPNLHIIGTMNTADRSLIGLDAALRRRFDFIELSPDPELLSNDVGGVDLSSFLSQLNARIESEDTRDHCIGHAYFMAAESIEDIAEVMRRKVIPQLQEYFHDQPKKLSKLLTSGEGSFVDDSGRINQVMLKRAESYNNFGGA